MKTIKEKVVWIVLTVIGYITTVALGTLFAYCWITSGHSEFIGGMITMPCLFGYILIADEFREYIMKKAFKKKETNI